MLMPAVLNLPIFPWFRPWDPYPFVFLATFASAEAPRWHLQRDEPDEEATAP
jgi:uncharacterized membrane protein